VSRGLLRGLALAALTALLAVRAPFSVDELHYSAVALQVANGGHELPGHEGLPRSVELVPYRPSRMSLPDELTHLSPVAPPLYGVVARPFLVLGWRGLVLLNCLALVGAIWMTGLGAASIAPDEHREEARRLAMVVVGAGGFLLEYGPAVWPHTLSVFLVITSFVGTVIARREGTGRRALAWAALGGAAVALAAGVRFQNAFLLGLFGLGVLLGGRGWFARGAAFGLGAAPVVGLASWLNHARAGIWNPFSKHRGYAKLQLADAEGPGLIERLVEGAQAFGVRVIDYGLHPPFVDRWEWKSHFLRAVDGGAVVTHHLGETLPLRKALLQSSPWALAALVLAVLAWRVGGARRRELGLIAAITVANVGLFSVAGLQRDPGLCFNERYLHELVPLLAIALAVGVTGWSWRRAAGPAAVGALCVIAGASLDAQGLLAKGPLLLAVLAALSLGIARRRWTVPLLAACLGWSAATQLAVDLPGSTQLRSTRALFAERVEEAVPEDAVLFGPLWLLDSLGPAMVDGVTLAAPELDGGKAAPEIARTAGAAGRRVFVVPWGDPANYAWLKEFAGIGQTDLRLDAEPVWLIEIEVGN